MSDVQLGCYVGPWGPGNLIQAINEVAETGFEGVECPAEVVQEYEDRLHVFEEILDTSGLKLAGLLQGLDLLERDQADEQVERAANSARFASSTRAKTLTIFHNAQRDKSMNDEEWATLGAIVEEIGSRCLEFGIELCFLPRAMRLVSTEREIKRLLASTRAKYVSLAVDTAEVTLAGSSPQRVVRNCYDRIRVVRYRDASASKRRARSTSDRPGATPQFGRGAVRFDSVSKALLERGYSSWIIVDTTGDAHAPLDAAAGSFRFLMRKSGLYSF